MMPKVQFWAAIAGAKQPSPHQLQKVHVLKWVQWGVAEGSPTTPTTWHRGIRDGAQLF